MNQSKVKSRFKKEFNYYPDNIIFAPGRVNLIGEHTDYSEGYVMPIAINKGITMGISKNKENKIGAFSIDFNQKAEIQLNNLKKTDKGWFNYIIGIVIQLLKRKYNIRGINIAFSGNVPQGAGLSSSAALEVATVYSIQKLFNLNIDGKEMAKICQKAEHETIGVMCGIMDQFISRFGKREHALFIDTRTLEYQHIPIKAENLEIVIINSNVPHKLTDSLYNKRVQECKEAVKLLGGKEQETLRDFTLNEFNKKKKNLPKTIRKRALHVISENERVIKAKSCLKNNDFKKFGKLMKKSHESLRDNYEVSSKELDWLVDSAQDVEGVYGSRMTGAGFGGCTVTLIDKKSVNKLKDKIRGYEEIFGYKLGIYETKAAPGVFETDF